MKQLYVANKNLINTYVSYCLVVLSHCLHCFEVQILENYMGLHLWHKSKIEQL